MASSQSSSSVMTKNEGPINWAQLPQELIFSILLRLGMEEILLSVQKVCRSWRYVCIDPLLWRKIDMRDLQGSFILYFDRLFCEAVELSQGGLLDINFGEFVSDDLLNYVADRSSNLRSLGLAMCHPMTNDGLVNAIKKLPLLETLEISESGLKLNLKAIGHACPQLQTFKLNSLGYKSAHKFDDDYALAIAESMRELCQLQLLGNRITDIGLNAILDNLPHLKHLDLRKCFNINFVGDLEKRCLEKIKELRRPDDSTAEYPFNIVVHNSDLDGDGEDDTNYELYGNYLSFGLCVESLLRMLRQVVLVCLVSTYVLVRTMFGCFC